MMAQPFDFTPAHDPALGDDCKCRRCIRRHRSHKLDETLMDLVQHDSLSLAALYKKGREAGVLQARSDYH